MEKFKEKKIVNILDIIIVIGLILFLLCLFLMPFSKVFGLGFLILPSMIPIILLSWYFSDKNKYTSELLKYMRNKLNTAKTLNDLKDIEKEFIYLAIENCSVSINLSYPTDLKNIHREILNKIDILEKQ